ncbi:MAG TPA: NAD-binding oxidoreductase, partial [Afifellaceae bacterium]|nr:NAD-binding oxidoreductase [Afifellaceae bacterium]
MRLFSYKNRPVHLGPYPLERLARQENLPDPDAIPAMRELTVSDAFESLSGPISTFIGMLDAIRDGLVAQKRSEIPDDPAERARHLKAAGYYFDASQVGICQLRDDAFLKTPMRNPV